jgi:DNA helicase-2/ATP-dependent DNA helicase PcrA
MAVLYRTNAQSRLFEEIFRRDAIPYQVVGSVQFYERKEIKDLLAYLKLAANPRDDVALRRVINTPARGIGDTTLATLEDVALARSVALGEAARAALAEGLVASRSAGRLAGFLALLDDLVARAAAGETVPALLERVIETTRWEAHLDKAYGPLASERIENVRALVSAAVEHTEEEEGADLQSFLDRSALVSDADEVGRQPGVTLMTIHCAKGLEFPVVFLTGLEERLFPHVMASDNPEDVEEERRLCYVAMTRARERLYLSQARFRRVQACRSRAFPRASSPKFPTR